MRKKMWRFLALGGLLALAGVSACGTLLHYSAMEMDDPATGEHLRKMENNKLGLMQKPDESYDPKEQDGVYLNVVQAAIQGHEVQYRLEVTVRQYRVQDAGPNPAAHYFKIKNGNSLFFSLDGQTYFFSTFNASRPEGDEFGNLNPTQSGIAYTDTAVYGTDRFFLLQLTSAREVRVKVFGEKTSLELPLTPWNQNNIRHFLETTPVRP
jgi:hypothetical protein